MPSTSAIGALIISLDYAWIGLRAMLFIIKGVTGSCGLAAVKKMPSSWFQTVAGLVTSCVSRFNAALNAAGRFQRRLPPDTIRSLSQSGG